jgi:hypothetical protein
LEGTVALPPDLLTTSARQLALFSLDQARMARVSQDVLDGMVRAGSLERPHRGVFAIAGVAWTWERRIRAACLAGGRGSAASHRAGAVIWELVELDDPPVEITVPRNRSPRFDRGAGLVIHRPVELPPRLITVRRGVPVTNPLLTIIDLAAVADTEVVQDAIDAGVALKLFTLRGLNRLRAQIAKPGRPGPGRLKPVLEVEILGDRARSVLEARMARTWQGSGLPGYVEQHVVRDADGRFVARPDFALPELKIAVEVDGWKDHGSPTATARDHRRRNRLIAAGWIVVTFTWNQVRDEPERVITDIRDAISVRLAA